MIGTLIDGRYRILRNLGAGSMGEVYHAHDVHLERSVAIKRPHAHVPRSSATFVTEAARLARMRSPNVAAIHCFGMAFGAPFFAMEHVDGTTLHEIVQRHALRRATLPLGRSVAIVRDLASALSEAHALGIVHRDVKPENVIVEHDTGRVVLVDFGVARDTLSTQRPDRLYGTLEYMAPELLAGALPSPASDQFALAVIAYEMLTGRLPFEGTPHELVRPSRPAPAPPSRHAQHAAPLDPVILRALSAQAAARFPTVASFATALRDAAARRPPEPGRGEPSATFDTDDGALRVLVIDDDPLFTQLATRCVRAAFADIPVSVSEATSGARAVERCTRRLPQLLLLDYRLPDTDGVELLTRVRSLPEGGTVRVVVLTAGVDEEAVLRFAALGVRRFARKPLDFDQVVELIAEVARTAGWLAASIE